MNNHHDDSLPLPTLLSYLWVAFTMELDNEFERLMDHRTTRVSHPTEAASISDLRPRGPWLVSTVMWSNCMRFVDTGGVTIREVEQRAGTITNWDGMRRWGYITISPDPADTRPAPPQSDWLVHATPAGKQAQRIWRDLYSTIEARWSERFGKETICRLQSCLTEVSDQLDPSLPYCMPILGYGLASAGRLHKARRKAEPTVDPPDMPLFGLLSRVLLAFTLAFEEQSTVSLRICANVLRLMPRDVRVRDLPELSRISKEGIDMAAGWLQRNGCAVLEPISPTKPIRVLSLTSNGQDARAKYIDLLSEVETNWRNKHGNQAVASLRSVLEAVAGAPGPSELLLQGTVPPAIGWRSAQTRYGKLPHHPMVLHRGGYPDGA